MINNIAFSTGTKVLLKKNKYSWMIYQKKKKTKRVDWGGDKTSTKLQNPKPLLIRARKMATSYPLYNCGIRQNSFLIPGSGRRTSVLGLRWNESQFFCKTQPPYYRLGIIKRKCRHSAVIRAAASVSDYYSTLNVSRGATLQEIKTSYRNLARKVRRFLQLACCLF